MDRLCICACRVVYCVRLCFNQVLSYKTQMNVTE